MLLDLRIHSRISVEQELNNLLFPALYLKLLHKWRTFKNALITKSMLYAIASEQDENYSGYKEQYDRAYKILINYTSGLKKEQRVYW